MPSTNRLFDKLTDCSPYEGQLKVATDLAHQLLNAPPEAIQAVSTERSYFVDHGIGHVERVIRKLDALDGFLANQINAKETFILLVAAYYHDIGMFIGRRENEDPEQTRSEHHTRSAEAIQTLNDEHRLEINRDELEIIKKVIKAHRVTPLAELPLSQRIEGSDIRTRLLGALLRMADSSDCDRSRAPKSIFDFFYDSIPEGSREYWKIHFPVTDVTFEGGRASIVVSINFEGDTRERIEKHRIANLLKRKLEGELASVEAVFKYYTISLVRVEIKDFDSDTLVDLPSLPSHEDIATITLCSDSEKIGDLIDVVTPFLSDTTSAFPLVIEFRPPEGPLFVDTRVKIDGDELDQIRIQLQERLGSDLWGLKGQAIEKMTLRRGRAN